MKNRRLPTPWLFVALVVLIQAPRITAQGTPAAELVARLVQSPDQPSEPPSTRTLGCGISITGGDAMQHTYESLLELDTAATPDIERAFDRLAIAGRPVPPGRGVSLLLRAYSLIKGPSALPRLRNMLSDPVFGDLRAVLNNAVALSLSLTSYVDDSGELTAPVIRCDRQRDARDALDQLIKAWQKNDPWWVGISLGPNAKAALTAMAGGKTWDQMRAGPWRGRLAGPVGYRFQGHLLRAQDKRPPEPADRPPDIATLGLDEDVALDVDVQFTDKLGTVCGAHRLTFIFDHGTIAPVGFAGVPKYLIDNRDLPDLLRLISACATAGEPGRRDTAPTKRSPEN